MSEILRDPNRIKELAEGVFGPERVDLTDVNTSRSDRVSFTLTIHFPEITIRNSLNSRNLIRDLFVQFATTITPANQARGNYVVEMYPTGTRTTFSLKEAQSGYTHSHLPHREAMYNFMHFCLGSSNFSQIIDNLKLQATEEDWELMFLSLTNYVSWESLEGGPYLRIAEIAYHNTAHIQTVTPAELEQELYRLAPHLPKQVWEFNPELSLIETHPDLVEFFNTYSRIRKMTIGENTGVTPALLENTRATVVNNRRPFIFKGVQVPIKIWDESLSEATVESSNHIDRRVVDAFITILKTNSTLLSKQIQYESVKNSRSEALRTLSPFQ